LLKKLVATKKDYFFNYEKFNYFYNMKLFILFLFSFQSIQVPIDYYFDSSESIIHILYKNKIDRYSLDRYFQLISSSEIINSNLYDLNKFKFVNEYTLSGNLGGSILKIKGDSIFRIDNSYEHKMQLGSLEFIRNDTLLRYGGYGFFENRNFFTFYDKKVNGWESLDIKGDIIPERISDFIYHFNKDKLYISGGYTFDKFKKDVKYPNLKSYLFDFNSKKWSVIGDLNTPLFKTVSFSLDENSFINFTDGMIYVMNFEKNSIKKFSSNPISKKIESSFFKPFINKNTVVYFELENDVLNIKSTPLGDFISNLKSTENERIYGVSYWFYSLIFLIFVIIFLVYVLFKNFVNKIIKIGDVFFYNLKKIKLNEKEKVIFDLLYTSSKKRKSVENRIITEFFEDRTLNYGTINRRKNESINTLNNKIKVFLSTNTDIIIRTNSQIDKREINYSINSDFL
jgi:type IV secretory pathway VirB3-like protein